MLPFPPIRLGVGLRPSGLSGARVASAQAAPAASVNAAPFSAAGRVLEGAVKDAPLPAIETVVLTVGVGAAAVSRLSRPSRDDRGM
jgi:hypothetical protein